MTGSSPADLYLHLIEETRRHGRMARATIVRGWGSIPREVGAQMLVDPNGRIAGTVGGGCGEAEVWQEARAVLSDGQARNCHVDLTEDVDSDNGKVCGGRFDVFIELWQPGILCDRLERIVLEGRSAVLLTYLGPEQPAHWKKSTGCGPLPALQAPLGEVQLLEEGELTQPSLRAALRQQRSQTVVLEGHAYFVDVLASPPDLVIAGAGHIARPLTHMANLCGYAVTVVDDRPEYARPELFPSARQVLCRDFTQAFQDFPWQASSHVVLVTRGHKHDEDCLRCLIGRHLAYIGMIGSKRRTRAVLQELADEGVDRDWLERIFAPIGIDIGAQTPEEISVCILAELIKVRRGGRAPSLKLPFFR